MLLRFSCVGTSQEKAQTIYQETAPNVAVHQPCVSGFGHGPCLCFYREVTSMVTITISGADKSGSLARISTFLVRKGYRLGAQQIAESGPGAKLVKINIEVSQVDKTKLAAEIKGISPDFRLLSVEGVQSEAPSLKEIAERFPDIAAMVRAYAESFSQETRDQELFQAGKKIGAFHYEKEWSFGSPLKMPVALRRALVPALEKLAKVDATDASITLPDS